MDKSNQSNNTTNTSSSSNSNNVQNQQKYYNRNVRNRQQVDRELPFKDLRELLNHKRQNSKNGGPPSDPKYNYLSDPMRDADSSNDTNGNYSGGTSKHSYRNVGRGRGRGTYPQKSGYNNEASKYTREWDQGKEEFRAPRNFPRNDGPPRYHDNKPFNTNYKGPPHKYNPNYRGGNHQRFNPRRNFHPSPDPVNISVEYNIEDGFRKCTVLDVKLDKTWNKKQNKREVVAGKQSTNCTKQEKNKVEEKNDGIPKKVEENPNESGDNLGKNPDESSENPDESVQNPDESGDNPNESSENPDESGETPDETPNEVEVKTDVIPNKNEDKNKN